MIPSTTFIRQSLELHLFFARIMKEHSFFLQLGFTPRDVTFTQQADMFRIEFDRILRDAISLSNGAVSPAVLQSGEVISPYTLRAEMVSSFYTGVKIPTELTQSEAALTAGNVGNNPTLEQRVHALNRRVIDAVTALIQFKATILSNVLTCKMFTQNYPLLIDHVLREARMYLLMVQRLENKETIDMEREAFEQELFWNRIMAEHSKFIRGLLDPTEVDLINTANNFGNEFDQLTAQARAAMDMTIPLSKVTNDSLRATTALRNFKAQGTEGLIECKIRSIILPLLGDHTLREANHYLRLLRMFKNN